MLLLVGAVISAAVVLGLGLGLGLSVGGHMASEKGKVYLDLLCWICGQ